MAVSKVEVVVLGLLAEEPMHGYDVIERARARGMGSWAEVGKASVYQALHRLERAGAISGRAQEGAEGPDRRVYRITGTGRRRLRTGLAERFERLAPYETDGGLALGFVHLLPAADARRAVDARERAVRDLLDAVTSERARATDDRGAGRAVADAMLDRQAALADAELTWIKGFRSSVGKLRR
ncbi:MAG TPA: helix-turn-helix transcriptional regulator [Actinomycetota bacterium]|jgi:DNA-binding PadR family transcriptional regulator